MSKEEIKKIFIFLIKKQKKNSEIRMETEQMNFMNIKHTKNTIFKDMETILLEWNVNLK